MRNAIIAAAVAAGLFAVPAAGLAQGRPNCHPLESIAEELAKYNAVKVGGGENARGTVSVFVDEDGDWVVVSVPTPNTGIGCVVESGSEWVQGKAPPPRVERKPETSL